MKKSLLILIISCACALNAQDVKIKKDKIYVNDALFLDADGCKFKFNTCPVKTTEGKAVFTVSTDTYAYYNNAAKAYKDRGYIIIRFLDFEMEMNSERTFKKLFGLMHKEKLIKEGKISQEDAIRFTQMYGDKIDDEVELIIR